MALKKISFFFMLVSYLVFSVPQKVVIFLKDKGNYQLFPKTDNFLLTAILDRLYKSILEIVIEIDKNRASAEREGYYLNELPYITYKNELELALL